MSGDTDEPVVAACEEDFSRWEWGPLASVNTICIETAKLVLDEMIAGAHIEFDVTDGVGTVMFGTFEYQVRLKLPLAPMMDYWIETFQNWSSGKILGAEEREHSLALLRDLEAATARLREALADD